MKKCSSIVWRFFDRIEENKRCVSVLCKLCDTQYKYFGNTTNLRTHLSNKHPIQWELTQNGTLDESTFRAYEDDESNQSIMPKRRKYKSVDILETTEGDNERQDEASEATIHLVSQMNRGSDEEWLEDDNYPTTRIETYEPQPKKNKYKRKIKREVETPPRRMSNYIIHNPTSPRYDNSEHILLENIQSKDEYSVFGEYVANKLRKFKTARTRGNIQQLITTMLWQAEYGLYDNPDSVKKILMYTVQESAQTQEEPIRTEIIQKDVIEEPNQSAETDSLSNPLI